MPIRKSARRKKPIPDVFSVRAIGDGDPDVYSPEELKFLVQYALQYGRATRQARRAVAFSEEAEAFRRRLAIINMFRELPAHLRNKPTGQATKDAVRNRLKNIGIKVSERTLARDYRVLGGAISLRSVKPLELGKDAPWPFLMAAIKR